MAMTPSMLRGQPEQRELTALAEAADRANRWRWVRRSTIGHELLDSLRFIGMRDRLRCPDCRAVGTWKPHGGWYDRRHGDVRAVRRWMCKCCGRYEGPEGVRRVVPNVTRGYWDFRNGGTDEYGDPPKVTLIRVGFWPWGG